MTTKQLELFPDCELDDLRWDLDQHVELVKRCEALPSFAGLCCTTLRGQYGNYIHVNFPTFKKLFDFDECKCEFSQTTNLYHLLATYKGVDITAVASAEEMKNVPLLRKEKQENEF